MGSDDGQSGEQPIHTVYLDVFYIDQYEVTNNQFRACVEAGGCDAPRKLSAYSDSGKSNHPVVYVDWTQANDYCEFVHKRLPSEAEWEKAALGTNGGKYPWGDKINCSFANYGNCVGRTDVVGSYPLGRSPYEVYDMVGNVWEWVADCYSEDYYHISKYRNPVNKSCTNQSSRVFRGGSLNKYIVQSTYRGWGDISDNDAYRGFRCALSP